MLQINAIEYAQWLCRDKIAAGHPDVRAGHGRIDQTHGKQGFDFDAHGAIGLFHGLHGLVIGDAQAIDHSGFALGFFQA